MDILNFWKSGKPASFSFEFFPARTEKGRKTLNTVIEKLLKLDPDFVSVTFGAGGSSRKGSLELVDLLSTQTDNKVLPYIAAYGLSANELEEIYESYHQRGIRNFLLIRGDEPETDDVIPHPSGFNYASEFIAHLKKSNGVRLGAAAYPEGHIQADSRESDWSYLQLKVDKGAEFIISNYFFDNRHFIELKNYLEKKNLDVPLIAGIMPIFSLPVLDNLSSKCGATVPQSLRSELAALDPENKKEILAFGIEHATRQCIELLESGVSGIHFYGMNKSKSILGIVENLRNSGYLKRE